MTSELLGLGLLDKADVQNQDPEWPAYKKYFMHGTSHHIGLDTHDYGLLHLPHWKPIWSLLLNLEFISQQKVLVSAWKMMLLYKQKESPINLMGNIPIEVDEIEGLMRG